MRVGVWGGGGEGVGQHEGGGGKQSREGGEWVGEGVCVRVRKREVEGWGSSVSRSYRRVVSVGERENWGK